MEYFRKPPAFLPIFYIHVGYILPYILGCRAHNLAVIKLIFDIVGNPAYQAAGDKQRGVEFSGDLEQS